MSRTEKDLAGSVALVTGAARNIGRAIAIELARYGARVAVNTLRSKEEAEETARLITESGGEAMVVLADVTRPDETRRMVETVSERLGPADILVNNAAVREEWPFLEITFEDWKRILSIVQDGAFNCAQACIPGMLQVGHGRIVNIGGETGHSGARERAHVVTAKAGLSGFTKALALDVAGDNITVNCVAPGAMNTPKSAMTRHPGSTFKAKRQPPVGRLGEPAEIAAMVRTLCSPSSAYVTGQTIHVNGGHYLP